jgi:diaminopimelate decarboxylase
MLNSCGVVVDGLHFHISRARSLGAWESRIVNMLQLADKVEMIQNTNLRYLDLGSGMYGHLPEELKSQFADVPTYADYASVVAKPMAAHYSNRKAKPMLITEPGTTLVSKYFSLYAQVIDIKTIRDKQFALLDCSFHNVGEICKLKKVPMKVHVRGSSERLFDSVDLVGYTCLEQDVLYSGYCGELAPGDIVEFNNVGGYSIVDKPPFIHPDIPVYMEKRGKLSCIKRAQTMDDIFIPYVF